MTPLATVFFALLAAINGAGGTVHVEQSVDELHMTYQGSPLHASAWTICEPGSCTVTVGPETDLELVYRYLRSEDVREFRMGERVRAAISARLLVHELAHAYDAFHEPFIDGSPGHHGAWVPEGHCRTSAAERYACSVALTGEIR